jgi:hypothetical protein
MITRLEVKYDYNISPPTHLWSLTSITRGLMQKHIRVSPKLNQIIQTIEIKFLHMVPKGETNGVGGQRPL